MHRYSPIVQSIQQCPIPLLLFRLDLYLDNRDYRGYSSNLCHFAFYHKNEQRKGTRSPIIID